MKTINDYKYSQRAVAPIIATLLMVAISVVGGILIFVFAQGFFTDTNIAAPSIESLHIFGYDATNSAAVKPHNFDVGATAGAQYGLQTANAANTGTDIGKLIEADHVLLYVRNTGNVPVVISSIKIFALSYTPVSAACTTALPAKLTFSVSSLGTLADCTDQPVIEAGSDVTVYIGYDEGLTTGGNGKIKIGRPLPVTIVTANGATFSKHLQLGLQLGG